MNEKEMNGFTFGSFVTKVVRGPAIVVDCSTWMAQLSEDFTIGEFVAPTTREPIANPENSPKPRSGFAALSVARLQLSFVVDRDVGQQPEAVIGKVGRIIDLVKGCGFAWDRANSNGEPGRITIQFVPTTEEAVARLPWLKETLTPVLADIREVTKPEWSEIPAAKV